MQGPEPAIPIEAFAAGVHDAAGEIRAAADRGREGAASVLGAIEQARAWAAELEALALESGFAGVGASAGASARALDALASDPSAHGALAIELLRQVAAAFDELADRIGSVRADAAFDDALLADLQLLAHATPSDQADAESESLGSNAGSPEAALFAEEAEPVREAEVPIAAPDASGFVQGAEAGEPAEIDTLESPDAGADQPAAEPEALADEAVEEPAAAFDAAEPVGEFPPEEIASDVETEVPPCVDDAPDEPSEPAWEADATPAPDAFIGEPAASVVGDASGSFVAEEPLDLTGIGGTELIAEGDTEAAAAVEAVGHDGTTDEPTLGEIAPQAEAFVEATPEAIEPGATVAELVADAASMAAETQAEVGADLAELLIPDAAMEVPGEAAETELAEPIEEPIAEAVAEPMAEPVAEPIAEAVVEVVASPAANEPMALDPAAMGELTPDQMAALMGGGDFDPGMPVSEWGSFPLELTPERAEILQFMVADAATACASMDGIVAQIADFSQREDGAAALSELAGSMGKISEFFGFSSLRTLTELLANAAAAAPMMSEGLVGEVVVRLHAIRRLFDQHIRGLECGMEMRWPLATFRERLESFLAGAAPDPAIAGWHRGDPDRVLELDLVVESMDPVPKPGDAPAARAEADVASTPVAPTTPAGGEVANAGEPMIRVSAAALDRLLAMVSQLVLVKNRIHGVSRRLRAPQERERRIDEVNAAADELSQLTGGLQLTMMQARTQPIGRLFERFPRVVRDVASLVDKQVRLETAGESTQIDKAIFDALADPVAQLLRFAIQAQIGKPDERALAGLPREATIRLSAENQGAKIAVRLEHDGGVPSREQLAERAMHAGLLAAESVDAISEADLLAMLTRPEMGEPALAGVAGKLAQSKGRLSLSAENGWMRIDLALPLSLAILRAIMVDAGGEIYAVPLQSVVEIIRLADAEVGSIHSRPVVRIRDRVIPIIDVARLLGCADAESSRRFGLVVQVGAESAVLRVGRIIGTQEVVIKTLEGECASAEMFSGATIRDDGGISLIFDVARLVSEAAHDAARQPAAHEHAAA